MPVPKKRHSQTRSDTLHSSWKLQARQIGKCSHCGAPNVSHRVCAECGTYKGIPVMPARTSKEKKKGQ